MIRVIKLTLGLIIATTVFTLTCYELVNVINWLFTGKWCNTHHLSEALSAQIFLSVIISPIIAICDYYFDYKSNKL